MPFVSLHAGPIFHNTTTAKGESKTTSQIFITVVFQKTSSPEFLSLLPATSYVLKIDAKEKMEAKALLKTSNILLSCTFLVTLVTFMLFIPVSTKG